MSHRISSTAFPVKKQDHYKRLHASVTTDPGVYMYVGFKRTYNVGTKAKQRPLKFLN